MHDVLSGDLSKPSNIDERAEAGSPPWAVGGVLVLAFGHFLAFVDRAIPSVYAPALKAAFGLSDTELGALQGPAFVLVYVLAMLLAGSGAVRARRYVLLAGCVAVWTAAGAGFALAQSYPALFLSRLVLGLGEAPYGPTGVALLASAAPRARVSQMVSIFTAGSATGRSGALLIGGAALALIPAGGFLGLEPWRVASLTLVLPNLLVILLLLRRAAGERDDPASGTKGLAAATRRLLSEPAGLGLYFLTAAGTLLTVQAAGAWSIVILQRTQGLDPATSAVAAGCVVLIGAPAGHLAGGRLLDGRLKSGGGPGMIIAVGVLLAALGAVALAAAPTPALALASLFLVTAAGGSAAAASLAGLQPVAPPAIRIGLNSLFVAFGSLVGFGLGPLLTGVFSDRLFTGPRGVAYALAVVMAGSALVTTLAALAGAKGWRRLAEAA